MLLSIVTVTYNNYAGLTATYSSIQKLILNKQIEWLVIDGGSTDQSVKFLSALSEKNMRIISEKDEGIYDAMNKGIKQSKARWIWFLNAGDKSSGLLDFITFRKILENNYKSAIIFEAIWENGIKYKTLFDTCSLRLPNHQSMIFSREFLLKNLFISDQFPISADIVHKHKIIKSNDYVLKDFVLVESELGGISRNRLTFQEYLERVRERRALHAYLQTGVFCRISILFFALKLLVKLRV